MVQIYKFTLRYEPGEIPDRVQEVATGARFGSEEGLRSSDVVYKTKDGFSILSEDVYLRDGIWIIGSRFGTGALEGLEFKTIQAVGVTRPRELSDEQREKYESFVKQFLR